MEKGLDNALLYSFAIVKAQTQCDRPCRGIQSVQDWALSQIEGCDNYRILYSYYTTLATCRQPLLDKIKQCQAMPW
ncbi:MAG: hypothetical protein GY821_02610 [Gammaproteobacteria bacterium]|nr:hypothetical protein [Gammaproteobacteria bacterium]